MLLAELIPQDAKDLGTMGTQAVLALGVVAFAGALVFIFKMWRADIAKFEVRLDEKDEKHEAAMREQRSEYTAGLGKITDAVRAVAEESRAHAVECRANFAAVMTELRHKA